MRHGCQLLGHFQRRPAAQHIVAEALAVACQHLGIAGHVGDEAAFGVGVEQFVDAGDRRVFANIGQLAVLALGDGLAHLVRIDSRLAALALARHQAHFVVVLCA